MKVNIARKRPVINAVASTIATALLIACIGCHTKTGDQNQLMQPHLPINDIQNTKLNTLSESLAFGQQQVDQMMHDRPAMATCISKNDIVYQWAVRQFAGEAIGQPIYWSIDALDCGDCMSENLSPDNSQKPTIRIRDTYTYGVDKGHKVSCEQLWAYAVFELYNITTSSEAVANYKAALEGKMSKQEWITSVTKSEFKALPKTAEFYRVTWKPWAESKHMETHDSYWYADQPPTYDEWIKQYSDPQGYPYSFYNKQYDEGIAPYIKHDNSGNVSQTK